MRFLEEGDSEDETAKSGEVPFKTALSEVE